MKSRGEIVRELVKDPSLRVTDIAKQTGYNKGHVSRLRKEAKGNPMIENKSAKTPTDDGQPVAFINVEKQKLEWAKLTSWHTPTIVNLPKIPLYTAPPKQWVGLTEREVELIDEMIETQLLHAERCDHMANSTMAQKQKAWDLERVELLRKLKGKNT